MRSNNLISGENIIRSPTYGGRGPEAGGGGNWVWVTISRKKKTLAPPGGVPNLSTPCMVDIQYHSDLSTSTEARCTFPIVESNWSQCTMRTHAYNALCFVNAGFRR